MSNANETISGGNDFSVVDEGELSQVEGGAWIIPAAIGAAAGVYCVVKFVQGYMDAK